MRSFENIEAGLLCLAAAQSLVQAVGSTFPSRARMALTSLSRVPDDMLKLVLQSVYDT